MQLQVVLLQSGVTGKPELLLEDAEKVEMRRKIEVLEEQIAALQKQIEAKSSDKNEKE